MHRSCRFTLLSAPLAIAALLAAVPAAQAASGTWTNPTSSDYPTPGNWAGGVVAGGAGFTADFSTLDISSDVSVALDQALTIGNLKFGDTNTGTGGSWELRTTNASVITLDNGGPKPEITVNPLVPFSTFDDAFIGHNLAGTAGFAKLGAGVLTLGTGAVHTITGGINIDAGTLRLNAAIPGQAITIGNGATLQTGVTLDAGTPAPGHTINVASGATANINTTATVEMGNFNAAGATLNVNLNTAGTTLTADGNWAINGGAAAVNFSSTGGGFIRLRPNSGTPAFNTATAFQNAAVNLDNITLWTRTNSGGNDVNIGALSGTATGVLGGGGQGGGTAARYFIGSLNTDTVFAGSIDSAAVGVPTPIGGINLIKVGTGKLTLSGTINNPPQVVGTSASTDPTRRGAVTQIQGGTLALTNSATITGGITDASAGPVLSTIDVQAAGTLDVTGYTGGTYQTQPLQQVVGAGTIVGNWNHAAGFIRPANTVPNFSANTTAVGGAINFNGDLALSGGDIGYDATLDATTGNDRINVTGSVTISGGRIIPNFLNGVPPSSNVYTVVTATGGITGSAASMVVDFPGRSTDGVPSISGNSLVFSAGGVTPAKNLTWVGNAGGTWDEEVTTNWTDGAIAEKFFQFDNVTLNDTATTNTVTINGVVRPGTVTVNTSSAYTFMGTGTVAATGAFTKTGTGNLTFATGGQYASASVTDGTLDIAGVGGALGSGPLSLNNVNVVANVGFNNNSLTLANANTINVGGNAASGGAYGTPALAGNSTLTYTTAVVDKWITLGGSNGFTGTINVGTAGMAGTVTNLRLQSAAGGNVLPGVVLNLQGATVVSNRQSAAANVVATFQIGELHAADPGAALNAFLGGSPAIDANWQIGALNTNSDFAGIIINGAGNNNTVSESHLTKVGTGELVLAGFTVAPPATNPYYTGDTAVLGGTLRVMSTLFSDASTVRINTGGVLNLDTSSTQDTIGALILNGVSVAPGVWGGPTSGAANTSSLLAGSGTLMVTAVSIPGDFDGNGTVNAADIAIWNTAGATRLGDSDGDFDSDGADMLIWQRNLGMTAGVAAAGAVPEPAAALLLACGLIAGATMRRRRRA